MKLKLTLALAALLLCASYSQAQSNPFQAAFDSAVTNGAGGGGIWRGLSGNYNIASFDFLYNLAPSTNSLGAGLLLGGDYMWHGKTHVQNDVKGGFALQYTVSPLKMVGFTNFVVTINGGDCVATPHGKGVGIGNVTFAGANMQFKLYKKINFNIDPSWQKRNGQGEFDRSYVGIQGFFSLGF